MFSITKHLISMKKVFCLTAIIFSIYLFSGCSGSSLEADAKKLADITCRSQKMSMEIISKSRSLDMNFVTETNKLAADAAILSQELKDKYKDPEEAQKFSVTYLKALSDCQ